MPTGLPDLWSGLRWNETGVSILDRRDTMRERKAKKGDRITLSRGEHVLVLVCLMQFRGKWDIFISWLRAQPEGSQKRKEDLPLVEKLKERDQKENILMNYLIDNIHEEVLAMDLDSLIKVWEYCDVLSKKKER
jgi:hypothetical protein